MLHAPWDRLGSRGGLALFLYCQTSTISIPRQGPCRSRQRPLITCYSGRLCQFYNRKLRIVWSNHTKMCLRLALTTKSKALLQYTFATCRCHERMMRYTDVQVRVGAHSAVDGRPTSIEHWVGPQSLAAGKQTSTRVGEITALTGRQVRQCHDAARIFRIVDKHNRRRVLW